jgi:uroporphyrinogen decarboxylase
MTPRARIQAALHFKTPDTLPIIFPSLGINDIADIPYAKFDNLEVHRLGQGRDEWGCVWEKTEQKNMGQVKGHPIQNLEEIATCPFPSLDRRFYGHIPDAVARAGDKYRKLSYFMLLFERMHSLAGFATVLEGLYTEREKMEQLADRLVAFVLQVIETAVKASPGNIDGFGFSEDWGTQEATFISPALWRDFFKPRYARIFSACHRHGLDVWMHSCGRINDIIGDLIEIGVNAINLQQPRALGIDEIGRRFRGKICFYSTCDIQRTLPFGTDNELEAEAKELLEKWGTPQGGFIVYEYGDDAAIGVPAGRGRQMLQAFLKHQKYGRRLDAHL